MTKSIYKTYVENRSWLAKKSLKRSQRIRPDKSWDKTPQKSPKALAAYVEAYVEIILDLCQTHTHTHTNTYTHTQTHLRLLLITWEREEAAQESPLTYTYL